MYCYFAIGCAPKNGSKNVNLPPVTKMFMWVLLRLLCVVSAFFFSFMNQKFHC